MNGESVSILLDKFNLRASNYLPVEKGYRNESHPIILKNGQIINLIIYKSELDILDKVKSANLVSNYLFKNSFPARTQLDKRILQIKNSDSTAYCAIYNYLPGTTIPWEAYTMRHLKLLGSSMSDMHMLLSSFRAEKSLPSVATICVDQIARMDRYFKNPGVRAALNLKLKVDVQPKIFAHLKAMIGLADKIQPRHALHLDYVRGNILFSGKGDSLSLSGVIDFEKVANGNKVFDIARSLAFLLVDCKYKTEPKIRKYFLQSGYNKRGGSSFDIQPIKHKGLQVDLLEELVNFYLAYDFYKFLMHNPYEYLKKNEHYTRTIKLLQQRDVVVKVASSKNLTPNKLM